MHTREYKLEIEHREDSKVKDSAEELLNVAQKETHVFKNVIEQ